MRFGNYCQCKGHICKGLKKHSGQNLRSLAELSSVFEKYQQLSQKRASKVRIPRTLSFKNVHSWLLRPLNQHQGLPNAESNHSSNCVCKVQKYLFPNLRSVLLTRLQVTSCSVLEARLRWLPWNDVLAILTCHQQIHRTQTKFLFPLVPPCSTPFRV